MATKQQGTKAKGTTKPPQIKKKRPSEINLPPNAKNLPPGAQAVYRRAAAQGGFGDGWKAVKAEWEQNEAGKWVRTGSAKPVKKVSTAAPTSKPASKTSKPAKAPVQVKPKTVMGLRPGPAKAAPKKAAAKKK